MSTLTTDFIGHFPFFLLLILNSLQIFKLLTFFLIDFLSIYAIRKKNNKFCIHQLNLVVIESSLLQSIAIITTDASIKNNIATFILHIYISNQPLIKALHYAVFVTSSKAELFAIRCGISQASSKKNISKIIIITNSIQVAKKNFDPLSHPLQSQSVAIL